MLLNPNTWPARSLAKIFCVFVNRIQLHLKAALTVVMLTSWVVNEATTYRNFHFHAFTNQFLKTNLNNFLIRKTFPRFHLLNCLKKVELTFKVLVLLKFGKVGKKIELTSLMISLYCVKKGN